MAEWRNHFGKGAAALAALWLIAAPYAASAQWWEDEEAYEEGGFSDLENYEDYGLDNEGAAALSDPRDRSEIGEGAEQEDQIALGEEEREFWRQDSYAGYYDNAFDSSEWDDWF